ncbi:MAG: VacJ family lipoprotein [Pseudomonadota bacterium]
MRTTLLLAAAVIVAGCAATPSGSSSDADPLESLNRTSFAISNAFDKVLLKPAAKGYELILPGLIRQGITNVSRNLRTPLDGINNLLQGKGSAAANDLGRFTLNSTLGLGGLFDFATDMGLDQNNEDFGQTLAVWGVPAGPYVYIPVLGSYTLRDAFMIPLNQLADPMFYMTERSTRDKIYLVRALELRQRLFAAEALIKNSADRYVALRESYLQRREYLIYDGDPPVDDDFYDEFLEDDEPAQ